jgi:alcohol dehydrogenase
MKLKNYDELLDLINKKNIKSVFLVTGKKSYKTTGAEKKLSILLQNCKVTRFFDFEVNPKLEDVLTGVKLLTKEKSELIIAVGGGSVIDVAKSINVLINYDNNQYMDVIGGKLEKLQTKLPLIAIPTTSGTGSEATHFSVLYVNKKKYSVADQSILPNYALLDSELTYSASPYLTAVSGLDALCQSIESYWAVNSTDESKDYASYAIDILLDSLENAVNGCEISKNAMSTASYLAGKAINISKTTAPHAVSYPITTHFGLPHGHAVAITLGDFLVLNGKHDIECNDFRGKLYVQKIMNELYQKFGATNAEDCRIVWESLVKKLGVNINKNDYYLNKDSSIHKILNGVNTERLSNNPIKITEKMIKYILVN